MNNTIISIGGENLDLYPDTVVAQSLKSFAIGDLTSRKFNFTNGFRVPKTPTNDRIFENCGNISSDTSIPYETQTATISINGIETVSNGINSIRSVNSDYNLAIFSGAKNFFETLGNQKLSDLVFLDQGGFNVMVSNRNVTTGLVFPVAYYGTETGPSDILVDLGFIYLHSIIDLIFSQAGFTKSGSVFSDEKYLKLIVSCIGNNGKYQPSFIEKRRIDVYVSATQGPTLVPGGDGLKVDFNGLYKTGTNPLCYWSTNEVLCNDPNAPATANLITLNYKFTLNITVTGGTVNIGISTPTYGGGSLDVNGVGTGVHTFETDINNENEWQVLTNPSGGRPSLSLYINIASGAPTVTITSGSLSIIPNGRFASQNDAGARYVYYNELLPNMTQVDLIKEVAIRYGLVFEERDAVVYAKKFDDIIADRGNAVDWTAKRIVSDDELGFTTLDYAQSNYFEYTNSDDDVNEAFGEGFFSIANLNSQLEKTIYTSPFDNTGAEIKSDILLASVPLYENTTLGVYKSFELSTGNKLLLVRDPYSYEPSVTFPDGNPYTDYLVAYFEDPNQDLSLQWQEDIDNNYPLLIESLQKAKIVTREYFLTEMDISQFSFFVPIFDSGDYFLVNEIKTFVAGRPTKVELFKV